MEKGNKHSQAILEMEEAAPLHTLAVETKGA